MGLARHQQQPKATAKAKAKAGAKASVTGSPRRAAGVRRSITKTLEGAVLPVLGKGKACENADVVTINRAPVLTLWMSVCLERLGHPSEVALSAAKVIAGRCARAKGRALGLIPAAPAKEPGSSSASKKRPAAAQTSEDVVQVAGHSVRVRRTERGLLALSDSSNPAAVDHTRVASYLAAAFKGRVDEVRTAMEHAAQARSKAALRRDAMLMYEDFRPAWKGWGVPGELRLSAIRAAGR